MKTGNWLQWSTPLRQFKVLVSGMPILMFIAEDVEGPLWHLTEEMVFGGACDFGIVQTVTSMGLLHAHET